MRGPPERADGTLQEEIKLIEGFLGEEVFKIMVIIATNRYRRGRPETVFYEEDIEITRGVFMAALEKMKESRKSLTSVRRLFTSPTLKQK